MLWILSPFYFARVPQTKLHDTTQKSRQGTVVHRSFQRLERNVTASLVSSNERIERINESGNSLSRSRQSMMAESLGTAEKSFLCIVSTVSWDEQKIEQSRYWKKAANSKKSLWEYSSLRKPPNLIRTLFVKYNSHPKLYSWKRKHHFLTY